MRLTTVILIASLMQVSAAGLAQKITLSERNAPLAKIFDKIRVQSGFDFVVDGALLKVARPVTIQVKDVDLSVVLEKVFSDQPLEFLIENKMVVVSRREPSFFEKVLARFQRMDVRGRVLDESGSALAGATIRVKGNDRSTTSGTDGRFLLSGVEENAVLEISYIGYSVREVKASRELGDVVLKESLSTLDQVQVVGYGTTTKRLNTGSVSSIKAETIAQQNVSNPLLALSGRVAGLQVNQSNGLPGSPVTVQIRGKNSINANNAPLYIVDGVPFSSKPIEIIGGPSVGSSTEPNNLGSPLNTINPSDIESIEVLKDADATAIYGSRASNGVILITTKKNSGEQTSFDVNLKTGFGRVTRYPKVLNTAQYLQLRTDAFTNSAIVPTATNAPDLKVFDQSANFDWQKWFIGNTTSQQDAGLTFRGGNSQTNFLISGSYHKENTVRSKDDDYQRGSFHINANHYSLDRKFQITTDVFYAADNSKLQNGSIPLGSVARAMPNYPIYNADGTYNWPAGVHDNYLGYATAYYKSQTGNLLGNVVLQYKIIPDLNAKINIGYNRINIDQINATPSTANNPAFLIKGISQFGNQYTQSIITEPLLTYKKILGSSKLEILLGGTLQNDRTRGKQFTLSNYDNDRQLESTVFGTVGFKTDNIIDYKYASVFSRINYNFNDKYILNLSARRDGSSRFGAEKQFGNFGSMGAAWLFTKENFFKPASWLSYGKLRASYGTTGNDGIPDYGFLSLYTSSTLYGNANTLVPLQIANQNYSWEVNKKLEVALELGFLSDRILVNTTWYRNRSNNQLVGYNLPSTTGFPSYQANLPALVQNKGWEFDVNTVNINTKKLNWTTSLNLTVPQNKLISFPNLAQSSYANVYVEGQSLNIIQGFHALGVDPQTGIANVQDQNGDGVYTRKSSLNEQGGDYVIIGKTDPKYFAGINNSLSYQGFQINVFFQYSNQKGYNLYRNLGNLGLGNTWTEFLNYWKKPGDVTGIPKPFASVNNAKSNYALSDVTVSDASFLRLKTLSISYSLKSVLNKLNFRDFRVYVQGQNLFTFTKYKGYDPEQAASPDLNIPSLKMMTIGLQASF